MKIYTPFIDYNNLYKYYPVVFPTFGYINKPTTGIIGNTARRNEIDTMEITFNDSKVFKFSEIRDIFDIPLINIKTDFGIGSRIDFKEMTKIGWTGLWLERKGVESGILDVYGDVIYFGFGGWKQGDILILDPDIIEKVESL